MNFVLHVRSPFDDHRPGDVISDPVLIAAIEQDHRSQFVIRVAAPPAPATPPAAHEG